MEFDRPILPDIAREDVHRAMKILAHLNVSATNVYEAFKDTDILQRNVDKDNHIEYFCIAMPVPGRDDEWISPKPWIKFEKFGTEDVSQASWEW